MPSEEFFVRGLKYTKGKGSKIDDHVEEHLGCDLNTIIHNIFLEKFVIAKVRFEKDPEALGATTQLYLKFLS
ncbi:hypothetical protein AAG906_012548 [Vitis piasezkii]